MRSLLTIILLLLPLLPSSAQDDRRDVRRGNRQFRKENYRAAEIDYRKAVLKDSTSLKAQYNLASALYREQDYDSAAKALETVGEAGEGSSDYHFNAGDIALARQDYQAAVEYFRQSLLLNPSDLDAKENYTYAKKMLENRQNGRTRVVVSRIRISRIRISRINRISRTSRISSRTNRTRISRIRIRTRGRTTVTASRRTHRPEYPGSRPARC